MANFVNGSVRNEQSLQRTFHRCFLPSLIHLAKRFQRRIFRNRPIRNKNCLWRPCLSIDRDEMSNRNRGLSIDIFYKIRFIWPNVSEKNLKNQPIRNKNRLWRPCLLTDRDGMSNLYRGPSIDASYQVSDHLA